MTRKDWIEGYYARVVKLGARQCWLWTGHLKDGYGQLKRQDGQTNVYAHRVAMELKYGRRIPSELVVMHTCDNPRCCNPQHLRVATQKDNMADMHAKGRANTVSLTGDDHGSTKISDANVEVIRSLWARRRELRDITQTKLAKRFGVSQAQISRIVNEKRRK